MADYGFDIEQGSFSFFRAPISSNSPLRAVWIPEIYRYVVGHYAKKRTEVLRATSDKEEARQYKANNFAFCTFSGLFCPRTEEGLIQRSSLMCLEFDNIDDVPALKHKLLENEFLETELMFTSLSGKGVKWVVSVANESFEFSRVFKAVMIALKRSGLPSPNQDGSDVARACFLGYDPNAFINEKYSFYAYENVFSPRNGEVPF